MYLENEEQKRSYLTLLKNKSYFLYLIGMLISRFGDSIDFIAYGWMVFDITGSTTLMSLLYGINFIPNIIIEPLAGVFVNYKKKKNVLFVCNFGRAIVVTITTLMFLTHTLRPYHLFIFTFINSTFESFQGPASSTALSLILDKDDYSYGISLNSTLSSTVQLVGYGVAAGIIGIVGISGGMFVNALSFYLCGILMFIVKYKPETLKKTSLNLENFFKDFKEGLSYMKNTKIVLASCIFAVLFNMLVMPIDSLNVAYIGEDLKLGTYGISVLGFALSAGMLCGSFIFPKLREKTKGFIILISSGFLFGIAYISLYFITNIHDDYLLYILIFTFPFLLGFFSSLINMLVSVSFYENIESDYLSRAAGVCNSLCMASTPLSSVIVAGFCAFISTSKIYLLLGLFTIILMLFQIRNKTLQKL